MAIAFGHAPSLECGGGAPQLAANKQRQLAVGFCGGLVALFSSNLPVTVTAPPPIRRPRYNIPYLS